MPVHFSFLPDGINDILFDQQNKGLFLAGYDSLKRATVLLYAPQYGTNLKTLATFPYLDYMQYTPKVLMAYDHKRQAIYLLTYQHPLSWGQEKLNLFRYSPASGQLQLLAESPSPFWEPTAMVATEDDSVLVALGGLGPLIQFDACNETACTPMRTVKSAASNSSGKTGMVQMQDRLYFVVGVDSVDGTGGSIVCELPDGTLSPISWPSISEHDQWMDLSAAEGLSIVSENPQTLMLGPHDSLLVVTLQQIDEYGFSQGSLYAIKPLANTMDKDCGQVCWSAPQLLINSISNPRGAALDKATSRLFIVEQHSIRSGSYERYEGDVLVFCATGRYDCAESRNSGECRCAEEYGGPCCDIMVEKYGLSALVALAGSWAVVVTPLTSMIVLVWLFILRRRHFRRRANHFDAQKPDHGGEHAFPCKGIGTHEQTLDSLSEPLWIGGENSYTIETARNANLQPSFGSSSYLLHRALNTEVDTQLGSSPPEGDASPPPCHGPLCIQISPIRTIFP